MGPGIPLKLVRVAAKAMSAVHVARRYVDRDLKCDRKYDPERRLMTLDLVGEKTSMELSLKDDDSVTKMVRGDGELAPAFAVLLKAPHYDTTGNLISEPKAGATEERTHGLWEAPFDECFANHRDPSLVWTSLPADQRLAVSIGVFYSQIRRNGFMFWIINGYVNTFTDEVLRQLDDLGTPQAAAARALAVEAREVAERAMPLEDLADAGDLDAERELDDHADRCEEMDGLFDKLGAELMEDVDTRLAAM